jgi:hypothetical protein
MVNVSKCEVRCIDVGPQMWREEPETTRAGRAHARGNLSSAIDKDLVSGPERPHAMQPWRSVDHHVAHAARDVASALKPRVGRDGALHRGRRSEPSL